MQSERRSPNSTQSRYRVQPSGEHEKNTGKHGNVELMGEALMSHLMVESIALFSEPLPAQPGETLFSTARWCTPMQAHGSLKWSTAVQSPNYRAAIPGAQTHLCDIALECDSVAFSALSGKYSPRPFKRLPGSPYAQFCVISIWPQKHGNAELASRSTQPREEDSRRYRSQHPMSLFTSVQSVVYWHYPSRWMSPPVCWELQNEPEKRGE